MVFFSDKENSSFSIDDPGAFLSVKSIERRNREGVSITEEDLPVNAEYVNGLIDQGAEVYFTSRWMNGALVQMDADDSASIVTLPYVTGIELVAKGVKLSDTATFVSGPKSFMDPVKIQRNTNAQLRTIGVDVMHKDGYLGEGVFIAVFDAGFPGVDKYKPFQHLFDDDRIIATRDFVKNSKNVFQYNFHGGAVLSCIAASYGATISGTAPMADFMLCVTEDVESEYLIEEYNWLFAAELADSAGVDIINSSVGYFDFNDPSMNHTYNDLDGKTTVIAKAANMAAERGIIVVVSAGNEGNNPSWRYITTPADAENVLSVASVDSLGRRSFFSSLGPTVDGRVKPDIAAMGQDVIVFNSNGTFSGGSGTSYASPLVAGMAAGVLQANPGWSATKVVNAIRTTASQPDDPDSLIGYGIARYQLAKLGVVIAAADIISEKITVYPNPFTDNTFFIDFGGLDLKQNIEVSLFDSNGSKLYHDHVKPKKVQGDVEINFSHGKKGIYFLVLRSRKFEKKVKLIKI